jgi:uncharacterized protein YggE
MTFYATATVFALYFAVQTAAVAQERPPAPTVSVVGVAEVDLRPDIAVVTLTVTDDRPTANDASAENARVTIAVVDGLKGSGIDAKDISTVGLSMYPLMSEGRDPKTNLPIKPVITGFRASNTLRVRIHEIDRTGAFIAASVQNGALYEGVTFDLSDRETREDALRIEAVVNAQHRASLYAQGATMKLGPLRSLGADATPRSQFPVFAKSAAAPAAIAPVTIEPGVITLSEAVSATWELAAP